jgi:hypothetical protein
MTLIITTLSAAVLLRHRLRGTMAGQARRGCFFMNIPGPDGPGCSIGAPLALSNMGQRPINPIAQANGLG